MSVATSDPAFATYGFHNTKHPRDNNTFLPELCRFKHGIEGHKIEDGSGSFEQSNSGKRAVQLLIMAGRPSFFVAVKSD